MYETVSTEHHKYRKIEKYEIKRCLQLSAY